MPAKLAAERAEHLLLFNLFGDPLLELRWPEPLQIDVDGSAKAGSVLEVTGSCPVDGPAVVELVVRRDRLAFRPPPRASYPTASAELARFQEVYERANDPRLASAKTTVRSGRLKTKLTVPSDAHGPCHIRVFVEGEKAFALGATDVLVEP
jgi:hypothetical protein